MAVAPLWLDLGLSHILQSEFQLSHGVSFSAKLTLDFVCGGKCTPLPEFQADPWDPSLISMLEFSLPELLVSS